MILSRKGKKEGKTFPGELIRSIKQILSKTFEGRLSPGEYFMVEGCTFGDEIILRISIFEGENLKSILDCSIDQIPKKDPKNSLNIILDGVGHFLDRYFSERKAVVDAGWNEVSMSGKVFYVRQEIKS